MACNIEPRAGEGLSQAHDQVHGPAIKPQASSTFVIFVGTSEDTVVIPSFDPFFSYLLLLVCKEINEPNWMYASGLPCFKFSNVLYVNASKSQHTKNIPQTS